MKLVEFKDYQTYVAAQKHTLNRRGKGPYFTDLEITRICVWLQLRGKLIDKGICHGARDGLEVREFKRVFPAGMFMGTDLFPYSSRIERDRSYKKKNPVKQWDFSRPLERWVGAFDLVYSNSLDHARDPVQSLHVWMDQLKPDGYLFITWGKGHIVAGGADCFGASLYEYIELANHVGVLHDLLYTHVRHIPKIINRRKRGTRRRAIETVVLVIGKRSD